jgi:hypothetical protein
MVLLPAVVRYQESKEVLLHTRAATERGEDDYLKVITSFGPLLLK